MSDNYQQARVGDEFDVALEKLVEPWIGSIIWVRFDGGQQVQARIEGVSPGTAKLRVTETDAKKPLD